MPGAGPLLHLSTPSPGPHVRIDTGVREGKLACGVFTPQSRSTGPQVSGKVGSLSVVYVSPRKNVLVLVSQLNKFKLVPVS